MQQPSFISQDSFPVPKRLLDGLKSRLSFDNGATLSKILYVTDGAEPEQCAVNFVTVEKANFEAALKWIGQLPDCQQAKLAALGDGQGLVKITGVNSVVQELVKATFKADCEHVIELLTQVRGCHWLISSLPEEQVFLPPEEPDALYKSGMDNELLMQLMSKFKVEGSQGDAKFPAILACLGSGNMISVLDADGKMSGFHFCLFGGKSLQGIAQLMLGTASYDEIMSMAERGDRANVDLLIKEVVADDPTSPYGRFNGDIPMMNFGKAAEGRVAAGGARKEDVARSLVSLFCGNLLGSIISISTLSKVHNVYFGGNFFRHPLARREFENFKSLLVQPGTGGFRHRFLRNGGHLGAVGALVASNADAPAYLKFA